MVKYWQKLILMSIFCQFSSLTSSIYWQIQYKTKKLNTNIFWKPYVRFPSNKNYIDQCTQSDMMNLFKWSYSQFLFSWNIVSNLLKYFYWIVQCWILSFKQPHLKSLPWTSVCPSQRRNIYYTSIRKLTGTVVNFRAFVSDCEWDYETKVCVYRESEKS